MATMNVSEVTVGSAKATGAIWVAPQDTSLPTDATSTLPSTWNLLGFTSDAGVTIAESADTQDIVAWEERTTVYTAKTTYKETISFMPIQCNEDVAKLIWGETNVTVETGGKMLAKHTGQTMEPVAVVIETTPREGIVKRYCLTAQLTERGEQVMDGTQVDGRQLTFTALADEDGVTMYEHTTFTNVNSGTGSGD